MTSIPLVRMLTDAGYGSRRDASKLVNAGLVEVNGRIATSYTEKVDPEVDSIVVTGDKVATGVTRRVYLLMNKPEGYLTTTEDDRDRPTVLDLLPENVRAAGLHPAGRLDEDSTGLLILTNDGQLTYE
jgi:23S rRNA pseudouridine2605 synthase